MADTRRAFLSVGLFILFLFGWLTTYKLATNLFDSMELAIGSAIVLGTIFVLWLLKSSGRLASESSQRIAQAISLPLVMFLIVLLLLLFGLILIGIGAIPIIG